MIISKMNLRVASFILLTASVALAQDIAKPSAPEPNRPVPHPITLNADDVRAFPEAPAGFDSPGTNSLKGHTELF